MANGFKSGGRQKGTPNKVRRPEREIALQWGPDALQKAAEMAGLVKGPDGQPIGAAALETTRLAAVQVVLDRAYGKPTQPFAGDDDFDPIRNELTIRFFGEDAKDE